MRWWIACVVAALVALAFAAQPAPAARDWTVRDFQPGAHYTLGEEATTGDFALTDQGGGITRLSDFRGKVVLIAFGYTHCPDICPLTMVDFKRVLTHVAPRDDEVRGLMITVDPARDTPERLGTYLGHIDPRLIGLTGTPEQIRAVADQYGADYRLGDVVSEAGYFVAHSGVIYVMDATGTLRYLFPYNIGWEMLAQGVEHLLAEQG